MSAALSWFTELVITRTQASDVPWLVSKGKGTKPGGETGVYVPQTFSVRTMPGISLFLFLVSEPRKSFLAPVKLFFLYCPVDAEVSVLQPGCCSVLVNTRYLDGGRTAN